MSGLPDDAQLTEAGAEIAALAPPRGRIVACGALAREILAVVKANRWDHLEIACLPALLHNRPEKIPEAARAAIRKARAEGAAHVWLAYADCGTGGLLDKVCEEEGAERIAGPHCYAFFDGNAAFSARAEEEIGAFYLTDFLARQFEAIVWKGLGLDRHPQLRDMYFGAYDRLVYLAQTEDAALETAARAAAERLNLRFEKRSTGYGELAGFLERAAQV